MQNLTKHRAFLKWAGGKYSLIDPIRDALPKRKILIEPFVGAGSVFLNTDFDHYVLNDINPDLIGLYNHLKQDCEAVISATREYFTPLYNQAESYYQIREKFNQCQDSFQRAVLFVYLNRHGYNGLCRYNRSGGFNVPFGRYKKPYFPEREMRHFADKAQRATFICESFSDVFQRADQDTVIYCDPPYLPISSTANFTGYAGNRFTFDDQQMLANLCAKAAQHQGAHVLLSNHDTSQTRALYAQANLVSLKVKRNISQNGATRHKVAELLVTYHSQCAEI